MENADALLLPLPVEKTVCYGRGTAGGPRAIIAASPQIETFDEETLVEFAQSPRLHTLPPLPAEGEIEDCLAAIEDYVRSLPEKFLLALGGEHTVTYGVVAGLVAPTKPRPAVAPSWQQLPRQPVQLPPQRDDLAGVTVVQIDAHADLADRLHGRRWSHGTVMRRLWERGCRLLQIGVRSLSREEYRTGLRRAADHHLLRPSPGGAVGRNPGDAPRPGRESLPDASTWTVWIRRSFPARARRCPAGSAWRQMMEIIRVLCTESRGRLIGADIVEFVPSPVPPGCDPTVARLATKLLAWWWKGHGAVAGRSLSQGEWLTLVRRLRFGQPLRALGGVDRIRGRPCTGKISRY